VLGAVEGHKVVVTDQVSTDVGLVVVLRRGDKVLEVAA